MNDPSTAIPHVRAKRNDQVTGSEPRENRPTKKPRTLYVATRGVKEYRATIPYYVRADDCVLEVGCEWGTTTELIAERCPNVIGVDIGEDCIKRAREMRPNLRFEVMDAFDMTSILRLEMRFTKVYLDMSGFSGYASLLDLISLLNMYTSTLQPEVIVAKSASLKQFAYRCIPFDLSTLRQTQTQDETPAEEGGERVE